MAVNPDPKPGRWILPLVILGMIGFTYFFVQALPEASTETTLVTGSETTTTAGAGSTTEPSNGGTVEGPVEEYFAEMDRINSDLQTLQTELVAVNEGFDADPREVEFTEAGERMDVVAADTQVLADEVEALTPPTGLETNHPSMLTAIDLCATAAVEAVEGLRSSDTGELRRAAVSAYVTSASDFDTELQNAKSASGL